MNRYNTIAPPDLNSIKPITALNIHNQVNAIQTKMLFQSIFEKKLGDISGAVELRKEGILIHPGVNTPTEVSFQLSKLYHRTALRLFIAPLPPEANNLKEAGSVNVEFFSNGKSLGKFDINRYTSITKDIDLSSVELLNMKVTNQDGKAWFDWFMLGVVSE